MKKLDWYILKRFLTTFFFMLMVIMLIAVVFDVSEKIDDFFKNSAPLSKILFDYYLNFVLYFSTLLSPLLIFISVIFFTSKLASNTEIVAVLAAGVSFQRMLLPYFIGATLLAGSALFLNHWLVPHANVTRLEFEEAYLRSPYRNYDRNIHRQVEPEKFVYFESYNAAKDIGYKFAYEVWEEGILRSKIIGDYARWDSLEQKWLVKNYQIRRYEGDEEFLEKGTDYLQSFNFTPADFERRIDSHTQAMDYAQLTAFINKSKDEGSEYVSYYKLELYNRTALPFSTYILTLIGVAVSSRKVRGGLGLHLAFGILIVFAFIMSMKVSAVYATNAGADPLLATWIPNIMFGVLAAYLYRVAPK
ncbi:MAG TPA: permease [Flavobacteriales bacterium]|nr:permease [Flavobacteriales bacterium]